MTTPELTNLDHRYRRVGYLGGGGMGEVYQVHHKRLDRDDAIKVLKKRYAEDREFVERFEREAQSAARLNHPNIVAVYDAGEGIFEGRNVPYIAMEYVPGGTLQDLILRHGGPLPVRTAVELALQVARALQAAHQGEVIHRDIKPRNVLLAGSGEAKVADFGIAKAADSSSLTDPGAIMGTPPYMSPEQWRGNPVSPKSDLYSLGVVLYEMLTGKLPFDGTFEVMKQKHLFEQPRAPKEMNSKVPGWLNDVTLRLLAKEPGERYQDAAVLIDDLERKRSSPAEEETATLPIVPDVSGRSLEEARWTLEGAGLVLAGSRKRRSRERPGTVISTQPSAGSRVTPGTPVTPTVSSGRMFPWIAAAALALIAALLVGLIIWISSGDDTVEVPDLIGQTESAAERRAGDDFEVEVGGSRASDEPKDTVFSQNPEPGERAQKGSTIFVVMSTGPEPPETTVPDTLEVPDLFGQTESAAERRVGNDFEIEVGGSRASDEPKDTIISQDPQPGEQARRGSTISVVMSAGQPEPTTVTNEGKSKAESKSKAKSAGGQTGATNSSPCPAT